MRPGNICKPALLRLKEHDGCLQINSNAQQRRVSGFLGMFHLALKDFINIKCNTSSTFIASDLVSFSHLQMVSCPARLCFLPKSLLRVESCGNTHIGGNVFLLGPLVSGNRGKPDRRFHTVFTLILWSVWMHFM